jgi:hypothetical protein
MDFFESIYFSVSGDCIEERMWSDLTLELNWNKWAKWIEKSLKDDTNDSRGKWYPIKDSKVIYKGTLVPRKEINDGKY